MANDFHKQHNPYSLLIALIIGIIFLAGLSGIYSPPVKVTGYAVRTFDISRVQDCGREYNEHLNYCSQAFDTYFDKNMCISNAEKDCLVCVLQTGTMDDRVLKKYCPIK